MIVKGGSRKSGSFFASHLMKTEENERVSIAEMKGLYAEDVPEAFRELKALAAGTRAELEQEFHHEPTPPTPQPSQRKSREIADWENFRAAESGIDPKDVKAKVTALWQQSDSGSAFVAALEDSGYTLCQGDRGYCIIDEYGDSHSLVRRLDGIKTAELREYLSGMPLADLPTVAEAAAQVRERKEAEEEGSAGGAAPLVTEELAQREPHIAEPAHTHPKLRVLSQLAEEHRAPEAPDPRTAWFAENLPEMYPPAATARDYAELMEADMRANDCELPFTQGRTWEMWADHALHYFEERASSLSEKLHELPPELQERLGHLTDTVTQVKDKLSTYWQDFITEGREREPPEIQEPELER